MISEFFEDLSFEDTIMMAFKVVPSDLSDFYWTKTLEDLQKVTGLHIRMAMVKAMSVTESFMYVAAQVFGTKDDGVKDVDTFDQMKAIADMINGE